MELRRAIFKDIPGILRLASAYFAGHLSEEERQGGFLSARFTREQMEEMARDLAVIVAVEQNEVAGFGCASRLGFPRHPLVVARMIGQLDKILYQGRPLNSYKLFIWGPVCIDRPYRGRGLFRALFGRLLKEVVGDFELGVTLVARDNPHSLQAHVTGLGMKPVGEFTYKGQVYMILVIEALRSPEEVKSV